MARRQYSAWIRDDVLSLAGSKEIRGTGSTTVNHSGIASDVWKMMHLGLHPDTPDAEAQQALKNVC